MSVQWGIESHETGGEGFQSELEFQVEVSSALISKVRVGVMSPVLLRSLCLVFVFPCLVAQSEMADAQETTLLKCGNVVDVENERVLANTTLEGHIFHDPNNPKDCPKKLNKGDWNTSPPNGCSQTYREPNLQDGKITMRTRGFGSGDFTGLNQFQGPHIFRELDNRMIGAMKERTDRLCPRPKESE